MEVYLGLGSNLGERRENLCHAVEQLQSHGLKLAQVSPVVESPALLPADAPGDWNRPFLNLVLKGEVEASPRQWRSVSQQIQRTIGREPAVSSWAPRLIDIDILLWGGEIIAEPGLTIPDPELGRRAFVLSPLLHLCPGLEIPGSGGKTVFELSHRLNRNIPLWMAIVNITPDSFSDGGSYQDWEQLGPHIEQLLNDGVNIIDIGAESTRPGATAVGPDAEWQRLEPVLNQLQHALAGQLLRPLISIDTRHPETAAKALDRGADIINDVGGLSSVAMQSIARDSQCDWIAMHSLSVPADSQITFSHEVDTCREVETWLEQKIAEWDSAGLDCNRIIFDPGIGFGKDSVQSLDLLRQAGRFRRHGLRVLVGHSRKSFMKSFSRQDLFAKDMTTLGASLALCQQNVDIIRVHNVKAHVAAYRGWSHCLADEIRE